MEKIKKLLDPKIEYRCLTCEINKKNYIFKTKQEQLEHQRKTGHQIYDQSKEPYVEPEILKVYQNPFEINLDNQTI